jgi:signal peptidase I
VSQRPALGCLFEVVETLVLTLLIFLVIQNFVAQPYQVKQLSMERTLEPGQYVLVDKLTPRFSAYKRGDIVVFTPPSGWTDLDTPFIKRVIGLPGDRIEIRDDGKVYANDVELKEPYLYVQNGVAQPTIPPASQSRWEVGAGQLFVLGDHRMNSADSRNFGPIDGSSVIGRAWLRYWPLNTFGIVGTHTYSELQPAGP